MSWLSDKEVTERLLKEAEKECTRLGHSMLSWVIEKGTFRSRCNKCHAMCFVTPRSIHTVRMRGEAVQFPCGISSRPSK